MKSLILLCSAALVAVAVAQLTVPQVAGDWEGDSKCVNLNAMPGCKDEHVIFHMTKIIDKANKPSSNSILVRADKIVDKKPLTMGYLTFKLDNANFALINDFKTKNMKGEWNLKVKGNTITGTLTKFPENAVVRKITLTRKKK